MQVIETVDIERDIGEVFAFISDTANDPSWCDTVESVHQVDGHGPGPQARYLVVHAPIGKAIDYDVRTTDYRPPNRIAWRCEDRVSVFHVTMDLQPVDGAGTRITQTSDMRFKGIFRLLTPIAKHEVGKTLRHQFAALKQLLETDSASSTGSQVPPARSYGR